MKDEAISKRILIGRTIAYNNDRVKGRSNVYNSPIFELYNVAERVNLLDECLNMAIFVVKKTGVGLYGKKYGSLKMKRYICTRTNLPRKNYFSELSKNHTT